MIDIDPEPLKSLSWKAGGCRRRLAQFLSRAAPAAGLRGEVSLLLTGDRRMRALNRRFRHRDRPTDVLSFPAPPEFAAAGFAGDLAISLETAARQAAEQGHALEVEIEILTLHGLLHLAGYDHESDSGRMARRERALRKQLSLPLGLIERGIALSTRAARPQPKAAPPAAAGARSRPKPRAANSRPKPRAAL